jgi:hypothetical protein
MEGWGYDTRWQEVALYPAVPVEKHGAPSLRGAAPLQPYWSKLEFFALLRSIFADIVTLLLFAHVIEELKYALVFNIS